MHVRCNDSLIARDFWTSASLGFLNLIFFGQPCAWQSAPHFPRRRAINLIQGAGAVLAECQAFRHNAGCGLQVLWTPASGPMGKMEPQDAWR